MQQFSAPFWPAALSAHASEVDLILLGLVVLSTLLRPATNAARMPLLPIRWTQATVPSASATDAVSPETRSEIQSRLRT